MSKKKGGFLIENAMKSIAVLENLLENQQYGIKINSAAFEAYVRSDNYLNHQLMYHFIPFYER